MKYKEVGQIINEIIKLDGVDILKDTRKFNTLFDDLAPELVEERRILHRVLNEDILNTLYNMIQFPELDRHTELLKLDKNIRDFFGFSTAWSYLVIASFAEVIGCENPLTEVDNVDEHSSDNQSDGMDLFEINKMISKKIATGSFHALGIDESGYVIAVGDNRAGQCEVSGWSDIVQVDADAFHSVGLRKNGTVVATKIKGEKNQMFDVGQCNVEHWTEIVSIATGNAHTVGLYKDGTVVAAGGNKVGQCNVENWNDIISIAAGGVVTAGLKKDGTVVATGGNSFGQCNVENWSDIISIAVSGTQVMGLKKDGTVLTTRCSGDRDHGQCEVASWTDIVAISTSAYNTLGLKKDGTVISTKYFGDPKFNHGQTAVEGWKDIIAVSCSGGFSIGLKKDGTIAMVGDNHYGQDRVLSWSLFNSLEKYTSTQVQIPTDTSRESSVDTSYNKPSSNTNAPSNSSHINELLDEVRRLTSERDSLGIFSGKRKKEIDDQIQYLNQKIREMSSDTSSTSSFKMPVQDMFTLKGRGTVLIGQIEKGQLNKNDSIIINGKHDVVSLIECNRKLLDCAKSSDGTIGVLLKNIAISDVNVGDCIYK